MEEEDQDHHRHVRHASVVLSSQLLAESLHKEHGLDFEPSVGWWEHPDADAAEQSSAAEAGPSEEEPEAAAEGDPTAGLKPTAEERMADAARHKAAADKLLAEVYKRMENSPPKGEGRPPGAAFTKKGRAPGSPKSKSSRASKAKKLLSARKKKEAAIAASSKGASYLAAIGATKIKTKPKHQITGYEVEDPGKKQEKEPEKFSVEEQARDRPPDPCTLGLEPRAACHAPVATYRRTS